MASSTLNTKSDTLSTITAATSLEQLSSEQLKDLQSDLAALGYGLQADGILGPLTKTVWARFKSDNGLDTPDSVGPGSIAVLRNRLRGGGLDDVPQQAVSIVKTFEGLADKAYKDGVGVWTIGYGTTVYPNGQRVQDGESVTLADAVSYLQNDMTSTVRKLASTVPYWAAMNTNQRSALISFGYNLGSGFYGSSDFNSITGALRDHRWSDVPTVFALYSNPGDPNVHQGLLRRRIAEGDLWQGTGEFASTA
jgi:lysozyme